MIAVTVMDERGRLAGRVNAVDAAAAVVLLVVMPLAFGAYLLFRTPAPTLQSATPATIVEGPGQRLEIDGANLRPFMHVTLDTTPANSFVLGSTKYALVDLPALRPGVYDVVLYDYQREVARLPRALTVTPLAADIELELDGVFKAPSDAARASLKPAAKLPASGPATAEVVSLQAPVAGEMRLRVGDEFVIVPQSRLDVPATLRVGCYTIKGADGMPRCAVQSGDDRVVVAPGALLTWPGPEGPLLFQIHSARPSRHTVAAR